jgi:hypothetical protein
MRRMRGRSSMRPVKMMPVMQTIAFTAATPSACAMIKKPPAQHHTFKHCMKLTARTAVSSSQEPIEVDSARQHAVGAHQSRLETEEAQA